MLRKDLVVTAAEGLRGRNAELFVGVAANYSSQISIEHDDKIINAKSIMGVIALMVQPGVGIHLVASGGDEEDAIDALTRLVESDFTDY